MPLLSLLLLNDSIKPVSQEKSKVANSKTKKNKKPLKIQLKLSC